MPAPTGVRARVDVVDQDGRSDGVEVRRSARRRRTVSAYRDGSRMVVLIPASFSRAQEQAWVTRMVSRLEAGERRRHRTDATLAARAADLSARYLDGRATPSSIRWVGTMTTRWGSCTPADGTIRVSDRIRDMPGYVVDYVLLHELAHLVVPGHGPAFWALLAGYPRLERARGFLDGVSMAKGIDLGDDAADGAAAAGEAADGEAADGRRPGESDSHAR